MILFFEEAPDRLLKYPQGICSFVAFPGHTPGLPVNLTLSLARRLLELGDSPEQTTSQKQSVP